jgi:hypothetical protein
MFNSISTAFSGGVLHIVNGSADISKSTFDYVFATGNGGGIHFATNTTSPTFLSK